MVIIFMHSMMSSPSPVCHAEAGRQVREDIGC